VTIAAERNLTARPTRNRRGAAISSKFEQIDPLNDSRWVEFLLRHPRASIFHSPEWLEALRRTYGYNPVVFTTNRAGEPLRGGVVFCKVNSWLVRTRLVSLPFSDHTEPLVPDQATMQSLLNFLAEGTEREQWASVELRPPNALNTFTNWSSFKDGQQFVLHRLDLQPNLDILFRGLNKDSTQRKIRKAAREGMQYEEGRSDEQLQKFFQLSVMTRRRKGLPPPPFNWFRNVLDSLGALAKIRIATTRVGNLAGAILTLSYKDTVLFKYGASDARYHSLGTMPFLLWQAIEDAKNKGATQFDFGRSEVENLGLIHFKTHFGAQQSLLNHKIFPARTWAPAANDRKLRYAKKLFSLLPRQALILAGKLIYPHIG
jgi:CelD/BcsL family acetyltransferase involved in cellulose biosynthesis